MLFWCFVVFPTIFEPNNSEKLSLTAIINTTAAACLNGFQIHLSLVTCSAGDKNKLKWTFVAAAHPYMNLYKEHGLEFGHTSICFGQNVQASKSDAHSHSPHHLKLNLLFTPRNLLSRIFLIYLFFLIKVILTSGPIFMEECKLNTG